MKLSLMSLLLACVLGVLAPQSASASAIDCEGCVGNGQIDKMKDPVCGNGFLKVSVVTTNGICDLTGMDLEGNCLCTSTKKCNARVIFDWDVPGATQVDLITNTAGQPKNVTAFGTVGSVALFQKVDCGGFYRFSLKAYCANGVVTSVHAKSTCTSCPE